MDDAVRKRPILRLPQHPQQEQKAPAPSWRDGDKLGWQTFQTGDVVFGPFPYSDTQSSDGAYHEPKDRDGKQRPCIVIGATMPSAFVDLEPYPCDEVFVAYGTSKNVLDPMGHPCLSVLHGRGIKAAGLKEKTKFALSRNAVLRFNDDWFVPPEGKSTPKLGCLAPPEMRAFMDLLVFDVWSFLSEDPIWDAHDGPIWATVQACAFPLGGDDPGAVRDVVILATPWIEGGTVLVEVAPIRKARSVEDPLKSVALPGYFVGENVRRRYGKPAPVIDLARARTLPLTPAYFPEHGSWRQARLFSDERSLTRSLWAALQHSLPVRRAATRSPPPGWRVPHPGDYPAGWP